MFKRKPNITNKIRHIITKLNPKSPISEQYRTLRTNIDFSSADTDLNVLMVTSSEPGEGKSTVTANLAVANAQNGRKVLLVDADMRKPTVHYTFNLPNVKGLSNALVGNMELSEVVNTVPDVEGLYVMTSGPIPPNPAELLNSKQMEAFMEKALEEFDMIVFDTPPILAVTDAQILANKCDGSMLVIRSKQTEVDAAKKAVSLLQPAKAKFLGAVLNDVDKKESNTYYYYGS